MSRLDLALSDETRAALELAKCTVAKKGELNTDLLLTALCHGTSLGERAPQLASWLSKPRRRRRSPLEHVPVAKPLQPVLRQLAEESGEITPERLFLALAQSAAGRRRLQAGGATEEDLGQLLTELGGEQETAATTPESTWKSSQRRQKAVKALDSFGRMLTEGEPPHKGVVEMDQALEGLCQTLLKMKRRNAIIHGPPGTGKSALIYEFARRLVEGSETIPQRLRDLDVFELSPSFLRSGASMVGQYDERVKSLIQVLEAHPRIILFVDEIHSLFQSGMHHHGPFTEANESFKAALGRGDITCIGCTTTAEYRHYIEPDGALTRRFSEIRLEAPSPEATVQILKARLPRLQNHYAPLQVDEEMLERTVELAEEYLPTRYQPDKSIQIIDEACALATMRQPPAEKLTADDLVQALEKSIGRRIVKMAELSEEGVFDELSGSIVGQDEALRSVARAFVAGLGDWRKTKTPRGRFFFCGPTGVGKTQTALLLARILGGGSKEALLRIDCNTLLGSGHDSTPALNRLLGPPPGYIGYVRGQGGLLSRIREMPESIVLFDEIEKADPGVGKTLLQIMDDGRVEDQDGNLLDFRRAYLIFTTNAGCVYDRTSLGFGNEDGPRRGTPTVDVEAVKAEMRRIGHGEEFLGRIDRFLVFKALEGEAISLIVGQRLEGLREMAEVRGYELAWSPEVVEYLAANWQPRFGVRHLMTILRHRITEQLSVAEAQGELRDVETIRLRVIQPEAGRIPGGIAGLATHEREDRTLFINLA